MIQITNPLAVAGIRKATERFNADQQTGTVPLTVDEYASARLEDLGIKYASELLRREISPREFLARFPASAIRNITAASAQNDDLFKYLRLLDAASSVELDHPETAGGIALLVRAGLLTQDEADVILEM